MEIKRRLTKIAKTLSPQIEAMNIADEINRMAQRMEELIAYAQEKIDRQAERLKKNIPTSGAQAEERRAESDKIIKDHQTEESDENLADQQEAFDERNKRDEKYVDNHDEKVVSESGEVMFDPDRAVSDEEAAATAEPTPAPAKKKAKKKASKKK